MTTGTDSMKGSHPTAEPTAAQALRLYESMMLIRRVEERLLQPLDDRSPHAEFLAERGEGLHHLAYLVTDFDEQLAAIREADPETNLLIDGTGPGNPVRWAYLDGGKARGTVIELLERTPLALEFFGAFLDLVR